MKFPRRYNYSDAGKWYDKGRIKSLLRNKEIMTGKEIVLSALRSEPVDRVPWVPFVGVHGGSFFGVDATEYLHSSEHIYNGLKESKLLPVVLGCWVSTLCAYHSEYAGTASDQL